MPFICSVSAFFALCSGAFIYNDESLDIVNFTMLLHGGRGFFFCFLFCFCFFVNIACINLLADTEYSHEYSSKYPVHLILTDLLNALPRAVVLY